MWGIAWPFIRRGARPLPWMALAVLAFCMTTLWPLYYIYFDALMLFAAAAIAESLRDTEHPARWLLTWTAGIAVSAVVVALAVRIGAPSTPHIDFASLDARRWLYQGFAISRREREPPLPWIWGYDGTVALPRSSTQDSTIVVSVEPVVAPGEPPQRVTAFLNGRPLGTVDAAAGWQTLRFPAPRAAWTIGANDLRLVCTVLDFSDQHRHERRPASPRARTKSDRHCRAVSWVQVRRRATACRR